jgi:hypothetical protein
VKSIIGERGARIGHDLHALQAAMAGADTRDLARLAAEHGAARAFERASERAAFGARDLAHQHLAHAAGRAGDCDLHVFPPEVCMPMCVP